MNAPARLGSDRNHAGARRPPVAADQRTGSQAISGEYEDVVWIAGVARSGTSWVGQIFNSHPRVRFRFQPLFSYEFKNRVNEDSTTAEHTEFLEKLWRTETPFLIQSDKIQSGDYPRFEKNVPQTVLVFKENRYQSVIEPLLSKVPQARLVGVVRHPCAVLNSWSNNAREFPAGAVLSEQWRFAECKNSGPQDYFGYYKWKEVANLYLDLAEQYPGRVTLIHYEKLVQDRIRVAQRMLAFAGLNLAAETETFLQQTGRQHNDSYYSVFKKPTVVDAWKKELPETIVAEIYRDLSGTRLEIFLDSEA